MFRFITAGVLGLCLVGAGVATAQQQDVDDKAQELRVRGLGIRIGKAYVCLDEKARAEFQEEAHHLFDLIVQDVGSDLGYRYATAVGIGSTRAKKSLDCAAVLKTWEEIRTDYDLKEGS